MNTERSTMNVQPLTSRIIACRRLIAEIESEPQKSGVRRATLRDQSIFLEGLEEAARMLGIYIPIAPGVITADYLNG